MDRTRRDRALGARGKKVELLLAQERARTCRAPDLAIPLARYEPVARVLQHHALGLRADRHYAARAGPCTGHQVTAPALGGVNRREEGGGWGGEWGGGLSG